MFNLAEILTLLIGCLLALVFIDGVRRAIRIRRREAKVDLIDTSATDISDFEEEWQAFDKLEEESESQADNLEEEIDISPNTVLNIIHLHDDTGSVFSESSLY